MGVVRAENVAIPAGDASAPKWGENRVSGADSGSSGERGKRESESR